MVRASVIGDEGDPQSGMLVSDLASEAVSGSDDVWDRTVDGRLVNARGNDLCRSSRSGTVVAAAAIFKASSRDFPSFVMASEMLVLQGRCSVID